MSPDLENMSRDELLELKAGVERALASVDERRKAEARAAAEKAARDFGYSLDDVVKTAEKTKSKSPPKYRNPEDPRQTWTGKGRQPAWIKAGLGEGKELEDYAI